MTATEVLDVLHARGAEVYARDGKLYIRPRHVIDTAMDAEVRRHRDDLVAIVSGWDPAAIRIAIDETCLQIASLWHPGVTVWDQGAADRWEAINVSVWCRDRPAVLAGLADIVNYLSAQSDCVAPRE